LLVVFVQQEGLPSCSQVRENTATQHETNHFLPLSQLTIEAHNLPLHAFIRFLTQEARNVLILKKHIGFVNGVVASIEFFFCTTVDCDPDMDLINQSFDPFPFCGDVSSSLAL